MESIGREPFTGTTGEVYFFDVYTTDTQFNIVGCVYIFTKRNGNQYTPLYIGETQDPIREIPNHEKWPCLRQHGVDSICVLEESNVGKRINIKNDLIAYKKPPYNA